MERARGIWKLAAIGLAMVAVWGATAAQAQAFEWIVEGKVLAEGVKKEAPCKQVEAMKLETSIVGTPSTLKYGKAKCETWKIWNEKGKAFSEGTLALEEGVFVGNAACVVGNIKPTLKGEVTTQPGLASKMGVEYVGGGAEKLWSILSIEKCAFAGKFKLTGSEVAEITSLEIGVEKPYKFNLAIDEKTEKRLKLAAQLANFNGQLAF